MGEKIVLIVHDKADPPRDQGVSTRRSIALFGPGVTGWQVLPARAADFEEAMLRACALVL